jgi:putative hemolysin
MRALRKLAIAALGALALGACTPQAAAPETAPAAEGAQSFSRDMSAADKAACTSGGGTVQRRGRIQAEQCVHAFADAGKQCSDSAQCQGKCVGDAGDTAATTAVTGQCQADDHLFGCYAEVKGGKATGAICVD